MRKCFTILALLASIMICGCSKEESEKSLASRAGNQVGESLSDFASGVGEGVDQKAIVKVELSEKMAKRGLGKTIAKSLGFDAPGDKGISVYITSQTPFEGKLISKALNKDGLEVGRSLAEVKFETDDAQYVRFIFEKDLDSQLVEQYVVDIREEGPIEKPIEEVKTSDAARN